MRGRPPLGSILRRHIYQTYGPSCSMKIPSSKFPLGKRTDPDCPLEQTILCQEHDLFRFAAREHLNSPIDIDKFKIYVNLYCKRSGVQGSEVHDSRVHIQFKPLIREP